MVDIHIVPLSKVLYNWCLSLTHSYTPMAIGCHSKHQPARQEQLEVRCFAEGGIEPANQINLDYSSNVYEIGPSFHSFRLPEAAFTTLHYISFSWRFYPKRLTVD